MPVLQAYNISHQFDNGDTLFQQLSCSMTKNRVGLVGRNGVGKSVFAAILSGEHIPSSGTVTLPKSFAVYRQQPSHLLSDGLSIAQFLGKADVIEALKQIESGDCAEQWFDVIGEQWDLSLRLTQQLIDMGLPPEPNFLCSHLSGGQLARLQLWQLFESDVELLILDEPSNHLDTHAKQWLIESIRVFEGAILLISHDRGLLREMDEIWELSGLGVQVFGGNYDVYAEQKRIELQAVERQLASIDKQKKSWKSRRSEIEKSLSKEQPKVTSYVKRAARRRFYLMERKTKQRHVRRIAKKTSNVVKLTYKKKSRRCKREKSK